MKHSCIIIKQVVTIIIIIINLIDVMCKLALLHESAENCWLYLLPF